MVIRYMEGFEVGGDTDAWTDRPYSGNLIKEFLDHDHTAGVKSTFNIKDNAFILEYGSIMHKIDLSVYEQPPIIECVLRGTWFSIYANSRLLHLYELKINPDKETKVWQCQLTVSEKMERITEVKRDDF